MLLQNALRNKMLLSTVVVLVLGFWLGGSFLFNPQPVSDVLPLSVQATPAARESAGNGAQHEVSPAQALSSTPVEVAAVHLQLPFSSASGIATESATSATEFAIGPTIPPIGPTVEHAIAFGTEQAPRSATVTALPALATTAITIAGQLAAAPLPTRPPTATPIPFDGTPVLPTGAKYGVHNPNVPGRVVRIVAPSIKLDTKVYEVYGIKGVWEVADYAAGHLYSAKNPGDGGNVVLSGHNNWRGEVFRYLENLKPGDEIDLWTQAGKKYVYTVRVMEKLKEVGVSYEQRVKNGHVMDDTPQEQLTVITCWPYTTFTHRLIVIADPIGK